MMQRRLPPAPATDIDALIWWEVCFTRFGKGDPYVAKWLVDVEQDRRDADLMLLAQEVSVCGPAAVELYGIACRGWSLGVLSPQRFVALVRNNTDET